MQENESSSNRIITYFRQRKLSAYLLLFIGSNGSDISSKATVAASIDFLVIKAGGVKAHSLVPFLQEGSLHPLDLQDLGLDVCKYSEENKRE